MSAEFSLLLLLMMMMVMVMVTVTLLLKLDGDDLETHYRHTLEELGKRGGMLGKIFRKTRPRAARPVSNHASKAIWNAHSCMISNQGLATGLISCLDVAYG